MNRAWKVAKNVIMGLVGGVFCAIVWALLDRYAFGNVADLRYYTGVVFAYMAGTGPLSKA